MKTLFSLIAGLCIISILLSCSKEQKQPPVTQSIATILNPGWTQQVIPSLPSFADIFFNSNSTGYVAGTSVYKSVNGGITWSNVNTSLDVLSIALSPNNALFLVGRSDTVIKTTDGGLTFSNFILPANELDDVFFIDNNLGYCVSRSGLFRTADAGVSWNKIITTGLNLNTIYSTLFWLNATQGWIVAEKNIFKNNGSFAIWQSAIINPAPTGAFTSIFAASSSVVYAATRQNEIYKSADGGATFIFTKKVEGSAFNDLHFLTENLGYISQGNRILKTIDGGYTWTIEVQTPRTIVELHFTDSTHGWACGDSGLVLTYRP